jgi:hypothetical protein
MRRLMMLVGVIALASCGGNRSDDDGGQIEADTEADTMEGKTLKVPGDSVRLEDTLSAPPPSDSVR